MKATILNPSMLRLKEAICDARIYQTRHLLENGVDVNFVDEQGLTPLMRAAQIPDEKYRTRHNLLKLLLQYGANVNTVDQKGRHVLSQACMNEKEDIVRLLCNVANQDVDLNLQDFEGNTPLMHSVRTGNAGLVKFLLDELNMFQVDIDVRNHEDRTPYLEAKRLGYEHCAKILLTEGNASTNIQVNPFLDFIPPKDESFLKGKVRGLEDDKYRINNSAETSNDNPRSVQQKKKIVPLKKSAYWSSEKTVAAPHEKILKRKTSSPRKIASSKNVVKEDAKDMKNHPRRRKHAWNESITAPDLTSRKDEIEKEFELVTPELVQPAGPGASIAPVINHSSQARSPCVYEQELPKSTRLETPWTRTNGPASSLEFTRASPKITTELKPLLSRRSSEPSLTTRKHFRSYSVAKLAKEDAMDDDCSWYSHFSVYNSPSVAFLNKIMSLYAEQMSPDSSFRSGVKPVKPDEPKVPKISVVSAVPGAGEDLRSEAGRFSPVRSAMSSRSNSASSLASSRRFQSVVSRTVASYLTSKKSLATLRVQDVDF